MSRTTVKRILVGAWAIAFVAGAVGVLWRLVSEDADFGSYIPWGLCRALRLVRGRLVRRVHAVLGG